MRFKVVAGSQSGHCCFDFTVVDTLKPTMIGGNHYRNHRTGELEYDALCECFDEEDAKRIADALNVAFGED